MIKTNICIDTPKSTPRSIAYNIAGWVASNNEITQVHCGSRQLSYIQRNDVIDHFDKTEFTSVYGFTGTANELEIVDNKIQIKVTLITGDVVSEYIQISDDQLLNISKERNINNFKKIFSDSNPLKYIDTSFSLSLPNSCEWHNKNLEEILLGTPENSIEKDKPINFLPRETAKKFNISENGTAASRGHDPLALALIGKFKDGLLLDCGSGFPILNYRNVINFEIQKYSNTDIIGVGQNLPFKDNSFDVVFSHSVLEHVTDPFICAKEIERVLKPNGILYASVPFLIPLHGYPDHYYNMTQNGLRNLFKNLNEIECNVPNSGHPIYSISSSLEYWRNGLDNELREEFESLTVGELINNKDLLVQKLFSQSLKQDIQKNISCTNLLLAQKLN